MTDRARPPQGPAIPLREASLPGGRRLEVRLAGPDDVDGLIELYEGLDDDARYRRFFSAYDPRRPFFERMAHAPERGGACLVAVVHDPATGDGAGQIVGDASYELLANGNGELEVTVSARWQGWLGHYLLGALVDVATDRGVPNLEADVLVVNRAMLALMRARGCVRLPVEGMTTMRVAIGAAEPAAVPTPAAASAASAH